MENMIEILRKKKDEAVKELQHHAENTNAEALLSSMIAQLLIMTPEQNIGDTYGKHPAMLETLAKVCIPRFGDNNTLPVSPYVTNHCYGLLETIASGNMFDHLSTNQGEQEVSGLAVQLAMYSKMVRGSAYPEQTCNKIRFIQGHFDRWYEKRVGISPSRTVNLILALIKRAEAVASENLTLFREVGKTWQLRYRAAVKKKKRTKEEQDFIDTFPEGENGETAAFCCGYSAIQNEFMSNKLPADLASLELSPALTETEISAFKKHFCTNKESISDVNHMQRKTFYELISGKIIFSEISNGFDVVWDAFEEIAKLDGKFYSSRYQKKKANWLEDVTYSHLSNIFNEGCVYKNLTYPDPSKENGTTELDLAVKWGAVSSRHRSKV